MTAFSTIIAGAMFAGATGGTITTTNTGQPVRADITLDGFSAACQLLSMLVGQ